MKRLLMLLGMFIAAMPGAFPFEASLMEFQITSVSDQRRIAQAEEFNTTLLNDLLSLDKRGDIGFKYHPSAQTQGPIVSVADATQVCELNGWETVIFGVIDQQAGCINAEIHIYSYSQGKSVRTILLRSAPEDYENLITDCAQKIYGYFVRQYRIRDSGSGSTQETNSWVTNQGAAWWGVVTPWSEVLNTLVGYNGTAGFRFGRSWWARGEWALDPEVGVYLAFNYATNQPGLVPAQIYDAEFGPLLALDLSHQRRTEIVVALIPMAKFHFLSYQPPYSSRLFSATTWYGGGLNLAYRIWVNPARSFGIAIEAGAASFSTTPFYLEYHAGISLSWKGGIR